MRSLSAAPTKLILKIEVQGTYSRSSPSYDYDEALESNGNQSVGRLEVTVSEPGNGEENSPSLKILHHSVIEDPTERIKSHEVLLAPPSNGTYITTFWSSSLNTEIELPKPPPYFLNVTETGVEIGGTIFTWRDIENNANWPHEDDVTTYVNGEVATPWDDDVWDEDVRNAIVSSDDYCVRVLGPILLAELGFLVGHGRLESGLTCPTQITREALTRPEVLLELALSMPWESARRVIGPPELMKWLEGKHPESPKKLSDHNQV